MNDQKRALETLLKQAQAKSAQGLGKLISAVEQASAEEAYGLPHFLSPPAPALRLGITGPPGAGKSTLVSGLIGALRAKNLRVAVLAVDPSSPFSGGAILGDRIRYQDHVLDDQVFIRSLGTRGSLGGLSASAHRVLRVFDLCGFDVVLVETVGVGQTELDVLHVADEIVVVLVPESGDSIQAMKAGLMEVADIFVVNKADRPGAHAMAKDIESSFEDHETRPPVFLTTATSKTGLEPLISAIEEMLKSKRFVSERNAPVRLRHEAQMILRQNIERELLQKIQNVMGPEDLRKIIATLS